MKQVYGKRYPALTFYSSVFKDSQPGFDRLARQEFLQWLLGNYADLIGDDANWTFKWIADVDSDGQRLRAHYRPPTR